MTFKMRGYGPDEVNVYDCTVCQKAGRSHQIVEVPAGVTTNHSHWGPGVPRYRRQCSGCGAEDGPWVKATDVGVF
jgi:hypothetical protein